VKSPATVTQWLLAILHAT